MYKCSVDSTFIPVTRVSYNVIVPALYKVHEETHTSLVEVVSDCMHISYPKLLNRFRLRLVFGITTKSVRTSAILVFIGLQLSLHSD